MSRRGLLILFGLAFVIAAQASPVPAASLVLYPVADTTLIEDVSGTRANGAAAEIYVGSTQRDGARRGLIRFDFSSLPAGASVTSAVLTLRLERTRPESYALSLHRANASWGEGGSNYFGGVGGPAAPGDATWLHRSFGTGQFWVQPGGDYNATASASALIGDQTVDYQISGPGMVADIVDWRTTPSANHGWLLKAEGTSAKAFSSREFPDTTARPRLTIVYEISQSDGEAPLPGWAIAAAAALCASALGLRRAPGKSA